MRFTPARPEALGLTAAIVACALVLLPFTALAQTESEKANAFFEEAFRETLARSPIMEARLGIKDQYDRWDDISDAYAEKTMRILERQLATLRASVEYDSLDAETQLSYDLFVDDAGNRIKALQWRYHTYPVNQMSGWQSRVPSFLINYHKIETLEDAEAYVVRLEKLEAFFDQVIEVVDARAKRGVIPPKFVFDHVLRDCKNVIQGKPFDDNGEVSTLWDDFTKKLDTIDGDVRRKADLRKRADEAMRWEVRTGYQRLIGYLTMLEDRATTDDGAWKFPDGKDYYEYRLRAMTTTTMNPDDIHKLGLEEVERIHDEMLLIVEKVDFDGTLEDFFVFARESSQFYYPETGQGRMDYLAEATRIIDAMRLRLDDMFGVKPKANMIVKAVEPFREKSAGKAFYQRPSPDGSRPGVYYANLYRMSDMPTYQMEALAYHEGIPGHHMQLAIATELEDVPRFRRYARYTAHTEGWGLYSEYVPKEMGFYQDPFSDFGRLAMELWRACRLVVDTGMHHKRWSREKAIEFLERNTPNPHGDVVKAIDRYIVMPGQATAYKIGMIRILELREDARERLGSKFDIRGFHDVILAGGPMPLDMLEKQVDEWVVRTLGHDRHPDIEDADTGGS